jgi:hypothetical protein
LHFFGNSAKKVRARQKVSVTATAFWQAHHAAPVPDTFAMREFFCRISENMQARRTRDTYI